MEKVKGILEEQKQYFYSGNTLDISNRKSALIKLKNEIKKNESNIFAALKDDLNKSEFESFATEIAMVYEEIKDAIKNIDKWSRRKKVKTPISQIKASSYIYKEPYGTILIIAPWNYPFQLVMSPLVGAIAAGNTVVIKPSELAPATANVIEKIIGNIFNKEYVVVVQGDVEVNKALLDERFDYIFFTGSIAVGKIVMEAATKYLTPVTLELGGKSPCIVDKSDKIDLFAKRIVWGKLLNSGQTCVAPDYFLIHRDIKEEFLKAVEKYIKEFYGDNPIDSEDYVKIINKRHFQRILSLIDKDNILLGGKYNESKLKIEPTVVEVKSLDEKIMDEEIFGPIMPIITYSKYEEIINIVRSFEKPLALYLFTEDKKLEDRIIKDINFGGGCINDTIVHLATTELPFGGVGMSGMGSYHGKKSFDTFTHEKSILKRSNFIDIPLRYPPYLGKISLLRKIFK
ncbi:aldehyde dehydrogenase [Clostridium bornimense]|uniref:Aldehyde dehydrogenase n=1 Tax=Clostridium bornimense TaxID=1216932 RepID=W6RTB1_9CLOT|nr:aldehyde dehydrogenase [Clostridium bornimense]CDM67498.1 aldehyde dehydrogenase [Clostridium bornimense]